jgi:hypothetical protein
MIAWNEFSRARLRKIMRLAAQQTVDSKSLRRSLRTCLLRVHRYAHGPCLMYQNSDDYGLFFVLGETPHEKYGRIELNQGLFRIRMLYEPQN